MEAIFHGQAALDRVEEIRVNRADLHRLGRLLVKRAQGGLSADEETEALEFLEIQRKLLAHGPKPRMKGV